MNHNNNPNSPLLNQQNPIINSPLVYIDNSSFTNKSQYSQSTNLIQHSPSSFTSNLSNMEDIVISNNDNQQLFNDNIEPLSPSLNIQLFNNKSQYNSSTYKHNQHTQQSSILTTTNQHHSNTLKSNKNYHQIQNTTNTPTFSNIDNKTSNTWRICTLSLNSPGKSDNVLQLFNYHQIDILCLTETKLKNQSAKFSFPKSNQYHHIFTTND